MVQVRVMKPVWESIALHLQLDSRIEIASGAIAGKEHWPTVRRRTLGQESAAGCDCGPGDARWQLQSK
jgi:hypothetical protein